MFWGRGGRLSLPRLLAVNSGVKSTYLTDDLCRKANTSSAPSIRSTRGLKFFARLPQKIMAPHFDGSHHNDMVALNAPFVMTTQATSSGSSLHSAAMVTKFRRPLILARLAF